LKTNILALLTILVIALVIVSGTLAITNNTKSSTTSLSSIISTTGSSKTTTVTATFASNNTKTESAVSNYTVTTSIVPSSEVNSTTTSSLVVESSETPCIPTTGYISNTTLSEQSTTWTEQMVYDGTACNFGDANDALSAILIPANTLVWTNFQLQENGSYIVIVNFDVLPYPESANANITVVTYLNGNLSGSTPYSISDYNNQEITNPSLMPPSNSSNNSIFALPGVLPTWGFSGQADSLVNLNGTTITVALLSDKPLWICGWSPEDMSKGTGQQFGLSYGQLNGTYEWPDSESSPPSSLPQPTTTLAFELRVSGDYY